VARAVSEWRCCRAKKDQAITREEAMAVLTSAGAWAEFGEKDKGRLMPGMLADFAVLSQDVFQVPEEQIPATRSLLTIVGGRIAHRAEGF
jgi:predicted amidohydrolase YtcJ